MKREIKFRVWDSFGKEMIYIDDLYWFEENYYHSNDSHRRDDSELMQYTGLKDSKGTEIWEGDVVAVENEGDVITVCKYEPGIFVLEAEDGGHWTRQLIHQPERLEVIGNIYEHSHLIKS